jgi:hypothetical protein
MEKISYESFQRTLPVASKHIEMDRPADVIDSHAQLKVHWAQNELAASGPRACHDQTVNLVQLDRFISAV